MISTALTDFIARYDERRFPEIRCPQCNTRLKATDKFCSNCGIILDLKAREEINEIKQNLPEILKLLMNSEAAREIFEGMVKKEKVAGVIESPSSPKNE